jgi:hypothetical protein
VEILYVFLAAAFGYIGVALHKRSEFVRSTAVEIDSVLHRVENYLKSDDTFLARNAFLNNLVDMLEDAERVALELPDRLLKPVQDQIHLAMYVVHKCFGENEREHQPIHAAIVGTREVVAPLLRPYVFPPSTAKPRSFPDPVEFVNLIRTHDTDEAFRRAGEYHDRAGWPTGLLGELEEIDRSTRTAS